VTDARFDVLRFGHHFAIEAGDHPVFEARSLLMRAGLGLLAAVAALAVPFMSYDAQARINCDGRFQVQRDGSRIATPYCEDRYLAMVAIRSYGVSTSFARIRNSFDEKERVCRIMGHDSRVYDICLQFRDNRGNDVFR
jgi:hypothetical protein